jgi:hypothetical protein
MRHELACRQRVEAFLASALRTENYPVALHWLEWSWSSSTTTLHLTAPSTQIVREKKKLTTKKEGMPCMMPPNRRPQDSVRIHESCHVAVAQLSWMDAGARWVPSRSWLGTSTHTRTRPSIRGIFQVEQNPGPGLCVV